MKTTTIIKMALLLGAVAACAADGIDIEQFLANKREYNQKVGREFDQAKYTKRFAEFDQNGDGLLTADEWSPGTGAPAPKTEKALYPEAEKDPEWFVDSMKTRDQRLEWYKEAKFGMFVHWGVYSVLAGEWNGEVATGYSEHILRSLKIPLEAYAKDAAAKFNPVKFNADEWIRLCKAAGMKYFVITAKHHDGLAMWPSDVNEWDIADATPFGRDPLAELRDACKKYGIHFGFYYSQAQDWSHPGGQRNNWDFPGNPTQKKPGWYTDPKYTDHIARSEQYIKEKSIPQLLEIVERYQPEIIWFDTSGWVPAYQNQMVLKAMREVAPDIVVNSRIGYGLGDYASTCDQPDDIQPYYKKHDVWEGIPTTNLSYGYHAKDKSHKPASFFIRLLARTAECGGNMLMNIGPMGNGLIAPEDVEILKGIGQWMDVNGESIYGTTHTPLPPQTFGHVSRKGNKLYLHAFRWPTDGKITLAGLKTPISKASLLANGKQLEFSRNGSNDWKIDAPEKPLDPVDTVIVVETDGKPVGIDDDETIRLVPNISSQRLHVFESKVEGGLKWGNGSPRDNGVVGWNKKAMADGKVTWNVRVEEPVDLVLDLVYVAVEGQHGGRYAVSVDDQKFSTKVETQPKPDNSKKVKYIPHELGTVHLEPGRHEIVITGEEITGKELFMPSSIELRKAE